MVTTGAMPVFPSCSAPRSGEQGALGWPWRPRASHCGKQHRRPMSCAPPGTRLDLPEDRRAREFGREPDAHAHQAFLATR